MQNNNIVDEDIMGLGKVFMCVDAMQFGMHLRFGNFLSPPSRVHGHTVLLYTSQCFYSNIRCGGKTGVHVYFASVLDLGGS